MESRNSSDVRLNLRSIIAISLIALTLALALLLAASPQDNRASAQTPPTPTPEATPGQPDDSGEQNLPAIEGKLNPPQYPNMDSNLNLIVEQVRTGQFTAKAAAASVPLHSEQSVAVTIHITEGYADAIRDYLSANGGDPRNIGADYIEAYIPVFLLAEAAQQEGVISIRAIVPPEPAQGRVVSEGASLHGAIEWNRAGYDGYGVKIGIIDRGFEDFRDLMDSELPSTVQARCYTDIGEYTSDLWDCERDGAHGTAVTEAVFDIAPSATYYIVNSPPSGGDLRASVDWLVSEGVDVVNMSLNYLGPEGPGDGTSPYSDSPLHSVDAAVDGGILWANSAGNDAGNTWFGEFSDANGDRFHEFSGTDQCSDVEIEAGRYFSVRLRWDDKWQGASRDLDLYLYRTPILPGSLPVRLSERIQSGADWHIPYEILSHTPVRDGRYCVAVRHYSGDRPDWIQLRYSRGFAVEHPTLRGSIGIPADSANPGLLAVGAAHASDIFTIAEYSSRGPTTDGRIKPDIVGADDSDSQIWGNWGGTSQASPHVAGLAALVKERFPDYSPEEIAQYLKDNAEERGDPGPDNTWGYGFAKLPPLEAAEPWSAIDRAALEALYHATDGEEWDHSGLWMSQAHLDDWFGVTTDDAGRVIRLSLWNNNLTGEIPSELGSLANLRWLYLDNNELTGPIPAELGNLTSLERLNLFENQLSGTIPSELGNLSNLRGLRLWDNELTGEIPPELGELSDLEDMSLSNNELTGTIPSELGNLSNLRSLYLWDNELTGSVPAELSELSDLEWLSLSDNQLSGPLPATFTQLASLNTFWFGNNSGLCAPTTDEFHAWLESVDYHDGPSCSDKDTPAPPIGEEPEPLTGDHAVLVALYNATNGYNWTRNDNWLTDAPIGEWHGVETDEDGRVVELDLEDNQLSGEIPPELGDLSNLWWLDLKDNGLIGEIPPSLGDLHSLQNLDLGVNELDGEIPSELSNLTDLTHLNLGTNQLIGEIPAGLGRLTGLRWLYLDANQLSGEIPAALGDLTDLEVLTLYNNQLTGEIPAELGDLTKLRWLWLNSNELIGPIPAELGNLTSLENLGLYENLLTGAIPPELSRLTNLLELRLHDNHLTGTIPSELGDLTNLEALRLSGNELTGSVPDSLRNLTDLRELWYGRNQLTGGVPAWLGSLTNLEVLAIGTNPLGGEIPPELGNLTNLRWLYLDRSQLTGEIPPELGDLANLERLWLHRNQLTGGIPSEIGNLASLESLALLGNQLSGAIPPELGNLSNLTYLGLQGNQLTGSIPYELARLTNLEILVLGVVHSDGSSDDNQLAGEIPAWLGDLTSLTGLWLAHNEFTGTIPSELGNLANLQYLQLQGNQLTGAIPSELGGLTNLVWLNLDDNQLTGDIPSELGNLTALEWLTLAGNELTGCIPDTLRDVEDNDFAETGLPFCGGSQTTTIVFADLNWSSALLQNRIAQYIVEMGYDYPTDVVFGATLPLFQSLRDGDMHVTMEVWLPNQQRAWDEALAEGSVFSPGRSLGTDWQSAFVIPKYLQEQHPDLDSVEDLKDPQYKALFATSETGGRARLVSCVINWGCDEINVRQIIGYGLANHVEILNPGDLASLNADLYSAYEQGEPWLGYQWSTNEPALLLDLVRLEEPAYSDECWESTRACAYEDATILIAVNSDLSSAAPDVVDMLREWDFSVDTVYKPIARWQHANPDANTEAAAIRWLNDNIDRWSQWVTEDAAASIRAALEAGEIPDGWPEAPNITPPEPPTDDCVETITADTPMPISDDAWASDCESTNIPGSYARYYTFTLDAQADVTVTLTSSEDTVLYLLRGDRNGSVVAENDDHKSDCARLPSEYDSCITESLPAGAYTIEATTYDAGVTVDFTLTVSGIR